MRNDANLELDKDKFKKIPSLCFLYEINADGTKIRNVKSKRYLKSRKTYRGYWIVSVCVKGKKIEKLIHSLVAEAWIGNKPEGCEIDHIDKNKENNYWKNLRYVTHSENNLNRTMVWSIPVTIRYNNTIIDFATSQAAAKYIAENTGKPYGGIRNRLYKRRKHIFGYEITYNKPMQRLDTATLIGKEQSTENVYLVGDMNRWNNAKRQEEHDRVKHGVE